MEASIRSIQQSTYRSRLSTGNYGHETKFDAREGIVDGLCDRNGIRYSSFGTGKRNSKRLKSEVISEDIWLELRASTVLDERKEIINQNIF